MWVDHFVMVIWKVALKPTKCGWPWCRWNNSVLTGIHTLCCGRCRLKKTLYFIHYTQFNSNLVHNPTPLFLPSWVFSIFSTYSLRVLPFTPPEQEHIQECQWLVNLSAFDDSLTTTLLLSHLCSRSSQTSPQSQTSWLLCLSFLAVDLPPAFFLPLSPTLNYLLQTWPFTSTDSCIPRRTEEPDITIKSYFHRSRQVYEKSVCCFFRFLQKIFTLTYAITALNHAVNGPQWCRSFWKRFILKELSELSGGCL